MSFLSTIFLAFGLAMDAFVVSITGGIVSCRVNFAFALNIALLFAGFQMTMPLIGWWLGNNTIIYIQPYAQWIAFLLLCLIGAKMIYESFHNKEQRKSIDFTSIVVLLVLAITTSIDAFVSGVCISFLELDIFKIIMVIGIITLLLSLIGVGLGKALGCLLGRYAELVGGIILIIIGFQVLTMYIRGCNV
jgi:putative Mn2+ efflux pump MntP